VSPNRPASSKKAVGVKVNGSVSNGTPPNRRLSISGQQNGGGHGVRSGGKDSKKDTAKTASPGNNAVAAAPVDAVSQISVTDPVPSTP
jgi:Ase1/PRC1/MAP65 family protein